MFFFPLGEKEGEASKDKSKVLSQKKSKRRRIVISDDENEDSDDADNDAEQGSDAESDAGERNVFYDSEENEIEVEPEQKVGPFIGKKGRLVKMLN